MKWWPVLFHLFHLHLSPAVRVSPSLSGFSKSSSRPRVSGEEVKAREVEARADDAVVVVPPADEIRLGAARDAASRARSMCVVCVRAECGGRYAALSHPGQ
jgi:hypothetical protein